MSKSQELSHARHIQSLKKTKNREKKNQETKEKFVTRVEEFHMKNF